MIDYLVTTVGDRFEFVSRQIVEVFNGDFFVDIDDARDLLLNRNENWGYTNVTCVNGYKHTSHINWKNRLALWSNGHDVHHQVLDPPCNHVKWNMWNAVLCNVSLTNTGSAKNGLVCHACCRMSGYRFELTTFLRLKRQMWLDKKTDKKMVNGLTN